MKVNRRELRKKLGSRTARRQGTKVFSKKLRKPRPRVLLAALVRKQIEKQKEE
jgi:hypothetical protein